MTVGMGRVGEDGRGRERVKEAEAVQKGWPGNDEDGVVGDAEFGISLERQRAVSRPLGASSTRRLTVHFSRRRAAVSNGMQSRCR